jgi:ABC-type branched-subunit amino acid transport system substrate-binding protein
VTPRGRTADLQVQPVPNAVYKLAIGPYKRMAEINPEGIKKYGIMTGDLPATQVVRDQTVEAVEGIGYTVVYNREYASQNETGWRNFVQEMRDADVKILELVGQPTNLVSLLRAMDTEGWYPEQIVQQANFYDRILSAEGGEVAGPTYVRLQYYPFEMADENKATQDYLDLIDQYNKGGKVALLGAQGLSAWLLFATAADACGAELTRDCLLEEAAKVKDWTGGGLHAVQQPGNAEPSPCFLLLTVDEKGFTYDEKATQPTDGIYNCDPDNVVELEDDYGVPRPNE